MTKTFLPSLFFVCLAVGCAGGGTDDGSDGSTPTPSPTPTTSTPGGGGTIVIGQPGLCNPGDVARVPIDSQGRARFPLVVLDDPDVTCVKDNRREEYTMILYNTTAEAQTFELFAPINPTAPPEAERWRPVPPPPPAKIFSGPNEMTRQAQALTMFGSERISSGAVRPLSRLNLRAISEGEEAEFKVRADATDPDVFTTTSAILRKQGQYINIFLDRDVPYCSPGPSCGSADTLTDLHLQDVADTFDNNIWPLLVRMPDGTTSPQGILGSPSDIDADGRISVVITPILNHNLQKAAYSDPRNVLPFDPVSNAGSNEAEVIFAYAPDSLGNFKSETTDGSEVWMLLDADTYATKSLKAWLAFHLSKIISFNEHTLLSGGNAEDDWIDDGMAAVMADLAGFNIWRPDAWNYLATPQIQTMLTSDDLDCPLSVNPEYLFMLYYLQSQVDRTLTVNGDDIDTDLSVYRTLLTSGVTGIANLEGAVDFEFDPEAETEFQAIFKDWVIAIATSGTGRRDLQQTNDEVKYFFDLNPTVGATSIYGSAIGDANGSTRWGADTADDGQNDVGIDLNLYHPEEMILVENADEHTLAPGNSMYGYVAPYTAMFVRLAGLFQEIQTISVKGSSGSLKAFIVRRTDITYPHVYSESLFGSIDQHAEDLDANGPNPYWQNELAAGRYDPPSTVLEAPKVDYSSLIEPPPPAGETPTPTALDGLSRDYLTIVGRIDRPGKISVCPADVTQCALIEVPDTDKYILKIPNLPGRNDEGALAVVVRRQFDKGAETAALKPMLAIVSSKDVPYPYVPHPVRSAVVAGDETRQPYRWLTSQLICGDDQPDTNTNVPGRSCVAGPNPEGDTSKIIWNLTYGHLVENTGNLALEDGPPNTWDGDIVGSVALSDDCNQPSAAGSSTGYGSTNIYPVSSVESSPSPLGTYPWVTTLHNSFMEISYDGRDYPDVLFSREFLKNVTGYPPEATFPSPDYDPRSVNSLTLACHQDLGVDIDPDQTPDSPDDVIAAEEMKRATTLAEQILIEMSRGKVAYNGSTESSVLPEEFAELGDDDDVFALDGDSRDADTVCRLVDYGNNLNTTTVRGSEGALLVAGKSRLEPHIRKNLHGSGLNQTLYHPDSSGNVVLKPGKSYTIIVAGMENTTGNYEIRLRKIDLSRFLGFTVEHEDANPICNWSWLD